MLSGAFFFPLDEHMKIHDVAVIGGGSAGVIAVLRTVLNNDECLFFRVHQKIKNALALFG